MMADGCACGIYPQWAGTRPTDIFAHVVGVTLEMLNNLFRNRQVNACVSCCCIHNTERLYTIKFYFSSTCEQNSVSKKGGFLRLSGTEFRGNWDTREEYPPFPEIDCQAILSAYLSSERLAIPIRKEKRVASCTTDGNTSINA
jgi:hypothetical protein